MKRKRFSPTTIVMAVLLVGAMIMVAKQVTPPPPGPPETAKPADAPPAHHDEESHVHKSPPAQATNTPQPKNVIPEKDSFGKKPITNKSEVVVEPTYWQENKDGKAGIKETQERVVEGAAMAKKQEEENARAGRKNSSTPTLQKAQPPAQRAN